jgi:hypothetical protein
MPMSVVTICVAAAPPDAAYTNWAMSIAEAITVNSGAVAVISRVYAGPCDTVPTPTSVVGVNVPNIIPVVCGGGVCVIGWSCRGIEGGIAVIGETITIISAAADALCLGHSRRQQGRAGDCCRIEQLSHRSSPLPDK